MVFQTSGFLELVFRHVMTFLICSADEKEPGKLNGQSYADSKFSLFASCGINAIFSMENALIRSVEISRFKRKAVITNKKDKNLAKKLAKARNELEIGAGQYFFQTFVGMWGEGIAAPKSRHKFS